jgi:hypothetical protein
MMTRDHDGWWWVMAGAVLTAIATRLDLLDALFPENYHKQVHAVVELAALITGIFAGVARMSPLPISPEGRADMIQKKGEQMDDANIAAAFASIKAETAVKATTEAAAAAEVAKDESGKAANL